MIELSMNLFMVLGGIWLVALLFVVLQLLIWAFEPEEPNVFTWRRK